MGSTPFVPPIPGKDQPFVALATDALDGRIEANGSIAVIGGGLVGAETANYLATHGNDVTIIEMMPEIMKEEPDNWKRFMNISFKEHDTKIYEGTAVKSINEDGTIAIEKDGEQKLVGPFNHVLMAAGMRPVAGLKEELEEMGCEVVSVGDSRKPGNAMAAILDGYQTALTL